MRVLFLNPVGSVGGAEQALITAVSELRAADPSTDVRLIVGTDGPLVGRMANLGVGVEVLPMPIAIRRVGESGVSAGAVGRISKFLMAAVRAMPSACVYARQLRDAVRRIRPDLVHSNGIKCHLLSRVAVPPCVPVVWWVQDFLGERAVSQRLLRLASARCRTALAISNAVATDVKRVLPKVPVRVLYHAVDVNRFRPGLCDGEKLDQLAGLPPAPPGIFRAGLVATYARWKGHLVLLDAAARLAVARPDLAIRWYVVGGPIYHTENQFTLAELQAAAKARGLEDRVGFVPFQADTASIYHSLDVVVHASTLPEPFGLVIAEAMACGRAVVVSNAGGAAELITHDFDALAAAPGDVDGIATSVFRLATDVELRNRVGINARITVMKRFDAKRIGPQILDLYTQILSE